MFVITEFEFSPAENFASLIGSVDPELPCTTAYPVPPSVVFVDFANTNAIP